jgi:hypothetical protein
MSRKPPLTVVESDLIGIKPPRPLGAPGMALWKRVMAAYRIDDEGGIELLAQACAALDRAEQLAARIAEDGPVIYSKIGPKAHPAVKDELACRAFICRTLQRLGLNVETVKTPGHPASGGIGWRGE